jgi:hypothetical protein
MDVQPNLISRLHRIVAYFYGQTMQVPLYGQSAALNSMANKSKQKLLDLAGKEDKGKGGSGGGSTSRGLRVEKDPAASMRSSRRL